MLALVSFACKGRGGVYLVGRVGGWLVGLMLHFENMNEGRYERKADVHLNYDIFVARADF